MNISEPKTQDVFPTVKDMILAYRKVKTDLWWLKTVPALGLLAEYEDNLEEKLSELRGRILSGSLDWLKDDEFLGSVVQLPKKLQPKVRDEKPSIHYVELSDRKEVKQRKAKQWQRLECRPLAIPSIEFQILGVLWTMDDGAKWDAGRYASCRANVLRRQYVPDDSAEFPNVEATLRGPINKAIRECLSPTLILTKSGGTMG